MPPWNTGQRDPVPISQNLSGRQGRTGQRLLNNARYLDSDEDDVDDSDDGHILNTTNIGPAFRYDEGDLPLGPVNSRARNATSSSSAAASRGHSRSLSEKLPSVSSSTPRHRKPDQLPRSEPLVPSTNHGPKILLNGSPSQHSNGPSESTGYCATCHSKVRWPLSASEFRCTTCLMVNDTRPRPPPKDVSSGGTLADETSSDPISVRRTKAIIDQCIVRYLESIREPQQKTSIQDKIPRNLSSSPQKTDGMQRRQHETNGGGRQPDGTTAAATSARAHRLDDGLLTNGNNTNTPMNRKPVSPPIQGSANSIKRKPVATPTASLPVRPSRPPPVIPQVSQAPVSHTRAGEVPGAANRRAAEIQHSRQISELLCSSVPSKEIFKPLEDYIFRSFDRMECLNESFMKSTRPRPQRATRSEDSTYQLSPVQQTSPQSVPDLLDVHALRTSDTALKGRVVAKTSKAPPAHGESRTDKSRHSTTDGLKHSSHIYWTDVYQWYALCSQAGHDWRRRRRELLKTSSPHLSNVADEMIDAAIIEGRSHLAKSILKACESLVKRPGKPLERPGDLRFLLILLANPVLYPSSTAKSLVLQYLPDYMGRLGVEDEMHMKSKTVPSAWDQGHAYGIIKRILGLLSNVTESTQYYLTKWFARYEETQFRRTVDLLQGFLTHRLRRQHGRKRSNSRNPGDDLIPDLSGSAAETSAQLHAAIGLGGNRSLKGSSDTRHTQGAYLEDWQVKAVAQVMGLLFAANKAFRGHRTALSLARDARMGRPGSVSREFMKDHGQLLSTSEFYNSLVDFQDVIADYDVWEKNPTEFTLCRHPFLLSVNSKIRIMSHDAKRQMDIMAREALLNSILRNKSGDQYLTFKVRRDCLVQDSLQNISNVVADGKSEFKKALKIQFVNEEGIDAGGLRKEWFLLLLREIFDPSYGLFVFDEDDAPYCYFNSNTLEPSNQFFLVGALLGLAIYNSTIMDVALPPFLFQKLMRAVGTVKRDRISAAVGHRYTLDDLAEIRPGLARGLRQLLEWDDDVESTFCRTFTIEVDRHGTIEHVPLLSGRPETAVTNKNRELFVDLYINYLLNTQVARQFEPFKRGFLTVCGGNALSLFQPEEIELLVRGSDEKLDVPSLKAVAIHENWENYHETKRKLLDPTEECGLLRWFWNIFEDGDAKDQRKLLAFITGSDRIPAAGATNLHIKVAYGGPSAERLPIARTCFNQILLYKYTTYDELRQKLWTAVHESEGFGLK